MQLDNKNIDIENIFSSCRPHSSSRFRLYSVSSCSPRCFYSTRSPGFTFVVVIEIFEIDFLNNTV